MKKRKIYYAGEARSQIRKRTAVVALIFLVGFAILFYRCLHLHLSADTRLERLAKRQYQTVIPQIPPRGAIRDARGEDMAVSVPTLSLAARPSRISAPAQLATLLAKTLSEPRAAIFEKLTSDKKYVWIKRHLTPQEAEQLKGLEEPGLEWVNEARRFYPNRQLASQILGVVGTDGAPLGGLEFAYNEILVGKADDSVTYRDARGQTFEIPDSLERGGEEPNDLWITLNQSIQYTLETELEAACKKYHAKACTGIVMDPQTGAILAMASMPSFNPNSFQAYEASRWKNRAVTDGFEPGSIFKVILAAAALETGAVRPEDRFFCENGAMRIGKHLIHDHHPHGMLSFREILKVSSNIGFFKIGQRVGKEEFSALIERLGFGSKTGIDFPGEDRGSVRPVSSWKEIDFANVSFGQGVRVTPLQMVRAFAVLASGGYDVRPHFVSKVTAPDGQVVWRAEVHPRRILKEATVKVLAEMMTEVTEAGGTGLLARIPGYTVAGKTGTAQKVKGRTYSHTDFMSSFIGFAPAEQPKVVALISLDEPRGEIYGGVVAAPVFSQVVWTALRELGVSPQGVSPQMEAAKPALVKAELAVLNPLETVVAKLQQVTMTENQIPDFRGLSMREVLSQLENRRLPAELEGSGVAYQQSPLPGKILEKGEVCRISFREHP